MEQQYTKYGRCDFPGVWKYWNRGIGNTGQFFNKVKLSNNYLDNFGKHIHQLGRYELSGIGFRGGGGAIARSSILKYILK